MITKTLCGILFAGCALCLLFAFLAARNGPLDLQVSDVYVVVPARDLLMLGATLLLAGIVVRKSSVLR